MKNNTDLLSLKGIMLATVSLADGKVLQIEKSHAKKLLRAEKNLDAAQRFSIFNNFFRILSENRLDLNDISQFQNISTEMKMDLIRSCWEVAICDGELHQDEEIAIYEFIDQLALSRRHSIDAQKLAG